MGQMLRDFNLRAASAGLSAFIFMIFGALSLQVAVVNQFGLAEPQARSWIFITWLTTALVSLPLIIRYRQPLGIGWTIPGLVYLGSLAGQFTFEEIVGANLMAGVAIIVCGVLGVGGRIIHLVPLPILMGMFAASIVEFITRLADATAHSPAIVGPMLAAYLLVRALNNPRIPPVGIAAAVGAAMIVVLGGVDPVPVEVGLPAVAVPGFAFRFEAIVSVTIPMVVLVLGLGNAQGLGFLMAQGYRVPANAVTIAVGAMTVVNALLGGHPAAMTRISSAMLAAPAAGPMEKRYWAAIVAFAPAALVALATGLVLGLMAILPAEYVFAVAGLAIFPAFEDALARAFTGKLRFGAAVAFGVTLSSLVVAGIPSAFWALIAGVAASLLAEREELLEQWRVPAEKRSNQAPTVPALIRARSAVTSRSTRFWTSGLQPSIA